MLRAVCSAVLALVVLGGCTGGSGSSDEPGASPSATSTLPSQPATTPRPVVPAAPGKTACYRLTLRQLPRATNHSEPVPCNGPHTARTVFVGTLDTVVNGHSVAIDSKFVQRQLSSTCPRKLAAYVGGSVEDRNLSMFSAIWFSPTLAQSDRGADWFRCDVVAYSGEKSLLGLPRKPPGIRGVLDRPDGLDSYGLCASAAPGSKDFKRVICSRPHTWKAFDTVGLSGGKRFPKAAVRAKVVRECKSRAAARVENALEFTYGYEWPSREQWAGGQRFGYCWLPS